MREHQCHMHGSVCVFPHCCRQNTTCIKLIMRAWFEGIIRTQSSAILRKTLDTVIHTSNKSLPVGTVSIGYKCTHVSYSSTLMAVLRMEDDFQIMAIWLMWSTVRISWFVYEEDWHGPQCWSINLDGINVWRFLCLWEIFLKTGQKVQLIPGSERSISREWRWCFRIFILNICSGVPSLDCIAIIVLGKKSKVTF